MKEQLQLSTHLDPASSSTSSKDNNKRKRGIKKNTPAMEIKMQKKMAREARRQLSEQEKIRLQKQKNRAHAQKSRDQHREYVNNLQRSIIQLREQLQKSRHYCHSCRKLLNPPEQKPTEDELSMNLETINKQESQWKQNCFDMNETINQKGEPASFLRIFEEKQDHHLLKMVLFIVTIVVAVLFVNGPQNAFHQRMTMIPTIQTFSLNDNFDVHHIEGGPSSNESLLSTQIGPEIDKTDNQNHKDSGRSLFDEIVEKTQNKSNQVISEHPYHEKQQLDQIVVNQRIQKG